LIPPFAAAVILLRLLGVGYLRHSERVLLGRDTLLRPSIGITAVGARLTERLT